MTKLSAEIQDYIEHLYLTEIAHLFCRYEHQDNVIKVSAFHFDQIFIVIPFYKYSPDISKNCPCLELDYTLPSADSLSRL